MFKSIALASAALLSLATASQAVAAEAAPATFNLTVGHNVSGINNVLAGNVRSYSATSPVHGVFSIKATAWTLKSSDNKVYASKLTVYDGGLGVISTLSNDDAGGANGKHQIDGHVNKDFIVLQFSRQAKLTKATLNTYALSGTKDSDAIFRFGTTPTDDWQTAIALGGLTKAQLEAKFPGVLTSNTTLTGNRTVTDFNPNRLSGDIWLIGASWANPDSLVDAFKLSALSAIPEAQTWAMMIAGFGMAGAAMRRRTGRVAIA